MVMSWPVTHPPPQAKGRPAPLDSSVAPTPLEVSGQRQGGELGWMILLIQEDSFAKNNSISIAEVCSMDIVLSTLKVVPNHF